ncbi:MAG: chorismate mutase [Gemmatimonadaceae bacterium]
MVTNCDAEVPRVRAVRGATTVEHDDAALLCDAVRELLTVLLLQNGIRVEDIVSGIFTATPDVRCAFPARVARELGWTDVPMLCAAEIDVPGAQQRCLRVLLHVERRASDLPLTHVYLREAVSLRPDWAAP